MKPKCKVMVFYKKSVGLYVVKVGHETVLQTPDEWEAKRKSKEECRKLRSVHNRSSMLL